MLELGDLLLARHGPFSLSAGGDWITFLQSSSSEDPLNKLWAWSASSGQTKVIADLETLIKR